MCASVCACTRMCANVCVCVCCTSRVCEEEEECIGTRSG